MCRATGGVLQQPASARRVQPRAFPAETGGVTHPGKPIISLLVDDPRYDERIDAFVISLGERVDAFQDAELASDLDLLRKLGAKLAKESDTVGYPALAAAGRRVALACDDGPESIHKAVMDLTELGQRARRGHRSSA